MSHTMNIRLELKDRDALISACSRIEAGIIGNGKHRLYNQLEWHDGFAVQLRGWRYPIVVKDNGEVAYDNYNGNWGNIADINVLTAYYGLEKAKIEARRAGHDFYESYDEQKQEIELRISI